MPYATLADLEGLYTPDLLMTVADNDGDNQPDTPVVTRGLSDADGIINSYLSVRYPIPLAVTPSFLVAMACDIAIYRMAMTADRLTDEMRRRYEDAIAHLKDLATGKAGLGVPDPTPDDQTDNPAKAGRAYSFQSLRSS